MSYCGALPVDSHSSDSSILVDACLARVRKEAGLDDESVLPPLDVLVQTPPPARFVVVPAAGQLPSAEAIVAMGDKINARNLMAAAGVPVAPGTVDPAAAGDRGVLHK